MTGELAAIRGGVSENGYFHVTGAHTFEWYEKICAELGEIRFRTDVHFNPAKVEEQRRDRAAGPKRPGVYTDGELEFHTDNPTWNLLGWFCVEQDEHAGESLLLDLNDVRSAFTQEEVRELCAISIYLPVRDADWVERLELLPLLKPAAGSFDVYWVPWLIADGFEQTHGALLNHFREWLRQKETEQLISLRLKPGEALFIHNNRMLHGRRPLTGGSRRHLVRFAVADEGIRAVTA